MERRQALDVLPDLEGLAKGRDADRIGHDRALLSSVVIGELDPFRPRIGPDEGDAKLVVDGNGVLSGAISGQG